MAWRSLPGDGGGETYSTQDLREARMNLSGDNRPNWTTTGTSLPYEGEGFTRQDLNRTVWPKDLLRPGRTHELGRTNPLFQDTGGHRIGSAVTDEDLFTQTGENSWTWDPRKLDKEFNHFTTNPLYGDQPYIKDEYKINPYYKATDPMYKVREFPWMNEGGIASTRPGYRWGGDAGYDWSRAKGEGNLSANELIELGLSASPEGALSGVDETKSQRGQEILDKTYQGNMGTAQPIEDEDKPWWKFWNRGGIASTRPGYRWGGIPHRDQPGGDFGVDWDRGYGKRFNDLVMLESRLKQPTGRLLDDTVRTTFQNALQHGDSDRRYDFAIDRATDYGKSLDENMSLTQSQRDELEDYIARYNPMAFRAEGGAVGLEPGIASLMGYAKGGMVTRVKVPKGQSKWMRRFINNMRDS